MEKVVKCCHSCDVNKQKYLCSILCFLCFFRWRFGKNEGWGVLRSMGVFDELSLFDHIQEVYSNRDSLPAHLKVFLKVSKMIPSVPLPAELRSTQQAQHLRAWSRKTAISWGLAWGYKIASVSWEYVEIDIQTVVEKAQQLEQLLLQTTRVCFHNPYLAVQDHLWTLAPEFWYLEYHRYQPAHRHNFKTKEELEK